MREPYRFNKMKYKMMIGFFMFLLLFKPLFAQEVENQSKDTADSFNLEVITVTADKREVDSQQASTSITVQTDLDLANSGVFTAEELFNILPNMHLALAGPPADVGSIVSIRGISQTMSLAPSFGFYVDDIYYSEYDANLLDVERVELLRGPQGTLYGRNTSSGVLNIVTKKPGDTLEGRLEAGYGSFNTTDVKFNLSGPLVRERLYFRLAGHYDKSDGYMRNDYTDDDKVNEPVNSEAKVLLRYTPSDQLSFDLAFDSLKYESKYTDYVPLDDFDDKPYEANVDYEGDSLKEASGSNLRIEYAGESVKIISITAQRRDENELDHDLDFTADDSFRQLYKRDYDTLSQELRLLSNDKKSALQWLFGLYGFREKQDHEYTFTAGPDNPFIMMMPAGDYPSVSENNITGQALFGEASYTFAKAIKVTTGVRFDQEKQKFEYDATKAGGEKGEKSETFTATLPKLVVSYVGNPKGLVYAGATKGYKAGGFNLVTNIGDKFEPEFTWNYEIGVKSNWLDNRLVLNAAVYHIDWKDMQVNASNGADFYTENGGKATSRGYELELKAMPVQGLTISTAVAYTHSKFDDYKQKGTTNDFSDNYVPFVPDYTGHLGISYSWLNGLYATADMMHTGRVYMNNENTLKEDPYNIINAKLGYEAESFEVFLWAKNLLSEKYATTYADMRNYGYDVVARPGSPQTIGLTMAGKL
ncbi:MAG: TonB-dependent receptor [Proteobacteria bacterium]|nr:TonB-dependent receptor [Pseudomonadota bacterium]